jgi:hypothetical protein
VRLRARELRDGHDHDESVSGAAREHEGLRGWLRGGYRVPATM